MAELYLAKDTRANRMVVLKRILPYLAEEVEFLKMFLDEARIAGQLHHPNVVEVYELGRLEGSTFIAMEWVDGIDLRKVLLKEQERGAPIPPGIGAWVIARLCEALHHAHERTGSDGKPLGIIHRDVSPQNVMVSYRGEVKLVDFGIAKATAWMGRSKPGVIKGKFLYLAPEQLSQDKLDHRADLFALGTLLYELTVGKSPFHRPTTEAVIYSIRMEDPDPPEAVLPGYPKGLSRIVMRCLEKNRDARYQTAEAVRIALDTFIQAEAPTTQEDVGAYIAGLFGDDDERTSVFVPPNAQTKAEPGLRPKGPSPFTDEERTVSIPGAPRPDREPKPGPPVDSSDEGTTDSMRPARPRDLIATAPINAAALSALTLPPSASAGPSEPTLTPVGPEIGFDPTRISTTGPTELKTGDVVSYLEPTSLRPARGWPSEPSISTVSEPSPKVLVPPPRQKPAPPIPDDVTGPTNDERPLHVRRAPGPPVAEVTRAAPPERLERRPVDRTAAELPPVADAAPRAPRRRPTAPLQKKTPFDVDDHIATLDMANYEDSQAIVRNRRLAMVVIGMLVVAAAALLTWALWPSAKPAPKPVPPKPAAGAQPAPAQPEPTTPPPVQLVRVSFRGPKGTRLSVAGTTVSLGSPVELPPGPVTVRYTCPVKKKQRARTLEFAPEIPATGDGVTIDVPCL